MGKGGMKGLNVGCCLDNLKHLSKPNLHPKSSCLNKLWNSCKPSSFVMEGKKIRLHYSKEFEGLGVNYYRGSHITSCLDYVIMTRVMNQSCGLWLLSNALTTAMTLTIKLQVEMVEMLQVSDGTKNLAQFDYELLF